MSAPRDTAAALREHARQLRADAQYADGTQRLRDLDEAARMEARAREMEARAAPADEHLQMIEDCEQRESRLTEWEAGFIDSIRRRLEQGQRLSKKQGGTLGRVWDRVTAKG